MMRHVKAGSVTFGNDLPLVFICGPCQIESRAHALETAAALKEIAASAGVPLIYKSSFDKANRTSVSAARGIGMAGAARRICCWPRVPRVAPSM